MMISSNMQDSLLGDTVAIYNYNNQLFNKVVVIKEPSDRIYSLLRQLDKSLDSLQYSCENMTYSLHQIVTNTESTKNSFWNLSLNEILTLFIAVIAVFVGIWQFRNQMHKNRKELLSSSRINWYLSVIVLPQIEPINNFYMQLIDHVIKDYNDFNSESQVAILSKKQAERKEQINAFFDHLQSLIKSFDYPLSQKIALIVESLEDNVTKSLEDAFANCDSISVHEIRRNLLLNKKDIISALYNKIDTWSDN